VVGGKNASLGEMYQKLTPKGIRVPNGFAVTAAAYRHFLSANQIDVDIFRVMKNLKTDNLKDLSTKAEKVRKLILNAEFPQEIKKRNYRSL